MRRRINTVYLPKKRLWEAPLLECLYPLVRKGPAIGYIKPQAAVAISPHWLSAQCTNLERHGTGVKD